MELRGRRSVNGYRQVLQRSGVLYVRAIDLFSGAGGFTAGAHRAGIEVVWAGNHWPEAVKWHAQNYPGAEHVCQDLHQANWAEVPDHDIGLASPCCHGHSKARGVDDPKHDASRSTAWAVVSSAEVKRPGVYVVENVPEFVNWALYPAWKMAMEALGYSVAPHIIDAADYGAPQHRVRLFLICAQSEHPLHLQIPKTNHIPASSFIDFESGQWSKIERPGRSPATLARVKNGRARFGDRFVMPYYGSGSGLTGRSLNRPIGTITTRDRWAVVDGDRMRMLTRWECRDAMSFPETFQLPDNHKLSVHLLGNAVCPEPVAQILSAIKESA